MSVQVQFRRGTTAQNNAFTGALAEITVDTTTMTLRVHDGVTAGGFTAASLTATQTLTNKTLASPALTGNVSGNANIDGQIFSSGNITSFGNAVITANVISGNISTSGLITATGNITSTANVAGGNITTAGLFSAAGNVTGGNVNTGGLITATGNITGGNLITGGLITATGNITSTANVAGGNLVTAGLISATGNITGGNILGGANVNATTHTGTTVSVTGNITGGNLTTAGIITVNSGAAATAIVNGASNGVGNIGSSSTYFNQVFAKATTAQYADLAEIYVADTEYQPGTVLSFGGTQEVTLSVNPGDVRVAGVVSTQPAYIMNSACADTHRTEVALMGKVPTRVTGTVKKGDMMVSAGDGRACACSAPAIGSVIGKSLEDFSGADGVINIVVGRL